MIMSHRSGVFVLPDVNSLRVFLWSSCEGKIAREGVVKAREIEDSRSAAQQTGDAAHRHYSAAKRALLGVLAINLRRQTPKWLDRSQERVGTVAGRTDSRRSSTEVDPLVCSECGSPYEVQFRDRETAGSSAQPNCSDSPLSKTLTRSSTSFVTSSRSVVPLPVWTSPL